MNILITGAAGFIGRSLCERFMALHTVIGVDSRQKVINDSQLLWEQADVTDTACLAVMCKKYVPDVIIHCAGIAHQKIGAVDAATYTRINSAVTESLAKIVSLEHPAAQFIFLSSVSVYGEQNLYGPASEEAVCHPSSDYALSKLEAEKRLFDLAKTGSLQHATILRLAPVYDRDWSFNLDRRIFTPKHLAYLRFGSGSQQMSALARPNLVDFVEFLLQTPQKSPHVDVFNVSDDHPYAFNTLIRVFQESPVRPYRPVIPIPLSLVWLATYVAGCCFPDKKMWFRSCYDKLAADIVFSNQKMLETGFKPVHSLKSIFSR